MICAAGVAVFAAFCVYFIWDWLKRKPCVGERHKKCVFITGCDSGFGNGLARRLDSKGVPVFAACLTESGACELKEKTSERLHTVLCDVASAESVALAFNYVRNNLQDGQELWGIVNNAGIIGRRGPLDFADRKDFREAYEVNVVGVMDVTRTFLPMLRTAGGRIVNTASGAVMVSFPGVHPYLGTKAAVRSISAAIRLELLEQGIHVACVLPGWFRTPITTEDRLQDGMHERFDELPTDMKSSYETDTVKQIVKKNVDLMNKHAASDLTPVLDAYEHALFALCPRDEYHPGNQLLAFLTTSLPPPIAMFVVCLLLKGSWNTPGFIKTERR